MTQFHFFNVFHNHSSLLEPCQHPHEVSVVWPSFTSLTCFIITVHYLNPVNNPMKWVYYGPLSLMFHFFNTFRSHSSLHELHQQPHEGSVLWPSFTSVSLLRHISYLGLVQTLDSHWKSLSLKLKICRPGITSQVYYNLVVERPNTK